jgi:hypothetical protein
MRFRSAAFGRPLRLQHESEFDEELGCGREVVDHDADVVHPLNRHRLNGNDEVRAAGQGSTGGV